MKILTPTQRQHLKGLAHGLEPVVLIGNAGLTPAVLKEIDSSLKAHELIKVKAGGAEREDRVAWLEQICQSLQAQPVQHIGKILVIYREKPEEQAAAPARKTKPGSKAPGRPAAKGRVPATTKTPERARAPSRAKSPARGGPPARARTSAKPKVRSRSPARG